MWELSTLLGLPKPGNDNLYGIIILLAEMTVLLVFIFFAILIALAYIADVYRSDIHQRPLYFEKSIESTLDVIFVVFPTIIIIYLLVPSLGFIFNNDLDLETVFSINVIGHQWYRSYEYNLRFATDIYGLLANQDLVTNTIEFDSLMDQGTTYNRILQVDKRVILPVNSLIQVNATSHDVIHSWAVPQLGIKVDVIPGRIMTLLLHCPLVGVFYGQCSELCGANHAFMPICIQTIEHSEFFDWCTLSLNINPAKLLMDKLHFETNYSIDSLTWYIHKS